MSYITSDFVKTVCFTFTLGTQRPPHNGFRDRAETRLSLSPAPAPAVPDTRLQQLGVLDDNRAADDDVGYYSQRMSGMRLRLQSVIRIHGQIRT